jgi:bacterioferritin (cytochrome b1)
MAESRKDRDTDNDTGATMGGAFAGGAVGGIAGGALAGAAAGGLGGPAGAAIGAAVGAIAGAAGGKAVAGKIDPQTEDTHWKSNYSSRPYVTSGSNYDDYGPAYKMGYERYPDYHGRSFDEAESEFQQDWQSARGKSRLAWNDARHATRDAFERVRDAVTGVVAGATGSYSGVDAPEAIEDLNQLLRGELAASETYRRALEKLRDEFGRDARFQQLVEMHRHHGEAASELRSLVQRMGGTPSDDSGAWGIWSNTVMGAARIFGEKAALSALLSGERSGIDDYQDALKQEHTPDTLRHLYRSQLARNQEHIQQLEHLIEAA